MFIVGDFNETLHQYERNSGFLNAIGSADFKRFISSCNLLEYSLSGHRYTRFHGTSMSRIDRAFATPDSHLKFSGLLLSRLPRGLSDHCPIILGQQCQTWGWKPFRFLNCRVSQPLFMEKLEGIRKKCGIKCHNLILLCWLLI